VDMISGTVHMLVGICYICLTVIIMPLKCDELLACRDSCYSLSGGFVVSQDIEGYSISPLNTSKPHIRFNLAF